MADDDRPVHPVVQRTAAYSWRLLVIGAVAFFAFQILAELAIIALPIAIGLLVVRAVDPISSRLLERNVPPALVALLVVGGLLAVLIGTGVYVVPAIINEFRALVPVVQDGIADVESWIVEEGPFDISQAEVDEAREAAVDVVVDWLAANDEMLMSGAFLLGALITGLVLAILLAFFMVKDGRSALAWGRGLLPEDRRDTADRLARRAWTTLGGYLGGAALLGVVEGITIGLAVWIVGGTLVIPIILITFFAAFIPIVGPVVAGAIAVLATLVTAGTVPALIVLIVAVLVQQFDQDLLAPVIYGKALQLHPAIILVVIAGGGSVFGFVGVLLAVPVTAVVLTSLSELRSSGEFEPSVGNPDARGDPDDSETPALELPGDPEFHEQPGAPRRTPPRGGDSDS